MLNNRIIIWVVRKTPHLMLTKNKVHLMEAHTVMALKLKRMSVGKVCEVLRLIGYTNKT